MSPQPDHPDFTAAALGEASPADLAVFADGLAENEAWRAESDALLETAGRLAAALRQEPARGFLTLEQRQAVLNPEAIPAAVDEFTLSEIRATAVHPPAASMAPPAVPEQSVFPFPRQAAAIRRTARRPIPLRYGAWLTSAGIAAVIGVGIFSLAGPGTPTGTADTGGSPSSKAGNSTPAPATGIPSIALDPSAVADRKPGAPAPGMPEIPQKGPSMPPAPPPMAPLSPSRADAIATTAPEIRLSPATASQPADRRHTPVPDLQPAPGPHRGSTAPDRGALASPSPTDGR